jgi:hypothetical protein
MQKLKLLRLEQYYGHLRVIQGAEIIYDNSLYMNI